MSLKNTKKILQENLSKNLKRCLNYEFDAFWHKRLCSICLLTNWNAKEITNQKHYNGKNGHNS